MSDVKYHPDRVRIDIRTLYDNIDDVCNGRRTFYEYFVSDMFVKPYIDIDHVYKYNKPILGLEAIEEIVKLFETIADEICISCNIYGYSKHSEDYIINRTFIKVFIASRPDLDKDLSVHVTFAAKTKQGYLEQIVKQNPFRLKHGKETLIDDSVYNNERKFRHPASNKCECVKYICNSKYEPVYVQNYKGSIMCGVFGKFKNYNVTPFPEGIKIITALHKDIEIDGEKMMYHNQIPPFRGTHFTKECGINMCFDDFRDAFVGYFNGTEKEMSEVEVSKLFSLIYDGIESSGLYKHVEQANPKPSIEKKVSNGSKKNKDKTCTDHINVSIFDYLVVNDPDELEFKQSLYNVITNGICLTTDELNYEMAIAYDKHIHTKDIDKYVPTCATETDDIMTLRQIRKANKNAYINDPSYIEWLENKEILKAINLTIENRRKKKSLKEPMEFLISVGVDNVDNETLKLYESKVSDFYKSQVYLSRVELEKRINEYIRIHGRRIHFKLDMKYDEWMEKYRHETEYVKLNNLYKGLYYNASDDVIVFCGTPTLINGLSIALNINRETLKNQIQKDISIIKIHKWESYFKEMEESHCERMNKIDFMNALNELKTTFEFELDFKVYLSFAQEKIKGNRVRLELAYYGEKNAFKTSSSHLISRAIREPATTFRMRDVGARFKKVVLSRSLSCIDESLKTDAGTFDSESLELIKNNTESDRLMLEEKNVPRTPYKNNVNFIICTNSKDFEGLVASGTNMGALFKRIAFFERKMYKGDVAKLGSTIRSYAFTNSFIDYLNTEDLKFDLDKYIAVHTNERNDFEKELLAFDPLKDGVKIFEEDPLMKINDDFYVFSNDSFKTLQRELRNNGLNTFRTIADLCKKFNYIRHQKKRLPNAKNPVNVMCIEAKDYKLFIDDFCEFEFDGEENKEINPQTLTKAESSDDVQSLDDYEQ